MTDASGSTSWKFDKMGRIWNESRTIGSVNKQASMTYFVGGSVKTGTYPSGAVLTYTIGGAGQPLTVTNSTNSIKYARAPLR